MGEDLRVLTAHPISTGGEEINSPSQEGRDVSRRGKEGFRSGQVSGECWSTAEFILVRSHPWGPGGCHGTGGLTKKDEAQIGRDRGRW